MTNRRFGALAAVAVFGLLSACGDPPPEQAAAKTTDKPSKSPKAAELSGQMVAAVSAGKSASALGVHFALGGAPTVAKPLPVQIVFIPHQKFAFLRAHFEGHDGIEVSMGADFGPVNDVEQEKQLSHQLMLVPTKEGMFMVTVSVDSMGDDGNVVRIFSIPVIVGPPDAAAAAPPK